jgi:hypothetical protein
MSRWYLIFPREKKLTAGKSKFCSMETSWQTVGTMIWAEAAAKHTATNAKVAKLFTGNRENLSHFRRGEQKEHVLFN